MDRASPSTVRVSATIVSDDGEMRANFDATPWFESASDKSIAQLEKKSWCRSEEACDVAYALEGQLSEIAKVIAYCDHDCGFEVYIDEMEARRFVEARRCTLTQEAVGQALGSEAAEVSAAPRRPAFSL